MKTIQMHYYNKLRQVNPSLAKNKQGRSMIMNEAVFMASHTVKASLNNIDTSYFKLGDELYLGENGTLATRKQTT